MFYSLSTGDKLGFPQLTSAVQVDDCAPARLKQIAQWLPAAAQPSAHWVAPVVSPAPAFVSGGPQPFGWDPPPAALDAPQTPSSPRLCRPGSAPVSGRIRDVTETRHEILTIECYRNPHWYPMCIPGLQPDRKHTHQTLPQRHFKYLVSPPNYLALEIPFSL